MSRPGINWVRVFLGAKIPIFEIRLTLGSDCKQIQTVSKDSWPARGSLRSFREKI